MDRRAFVTSGLGWTALGCLTPWLDCYGARRDPGERVLVVFDSTLPASRAYAAVSNEGGMRRIEIGTDVGILWHQRLRDWPGAIRGVLRPSDCFILRNFSMGERRSFHSTKIRSGAFAIEIEIGAGFAHP